MQLFWSLPNIFPRSGFILKGWARCAVRFTGANYRDRPGRTLFSTRWQQSDSALYQDQDTRLRMPIKWHICKEGQAGNKKRQLVVFSKLPSLPSAGSRSSCFHTSLGCEPRSLIQVSLGCSIIQKKCEEGQSNSGLFASKRSKTPNGARGFLCGNGARLFFKFFDYLVLL
jgi:hypothetical protein